MIFFEEANIAGAPLPFVTISTVGPALMTHGSELQKERFLPGIAGGEIMFAIGYSEPDAGSDLAVLKTTARQDDEGFLVNGNKLWTSGAESADFVWLAARTDPTQLRHKGISLLIVDTLTPGFSHTLIPTTSIPTTATYYDNVRVPNEMLVGELNGGWKLITSQLNHERLGLGTWSDKVVALFRRVYLWARARDEQGRRAMDKAWVRSSLAECYARLEAMRPDQHAHCRRPGARPYGRGPELDHQGVRLGVGDRDPAQAGVDPRCQWLDAQRLGRDPVAGRAGVRIAQFGDPDVRRRHQ